MPENLFGEEQPYPKPTINGSWYQVVKMRNKYRLAENKKESCRNCDNHKCYEYHNKYYHKCLLIGISNSEATDIRLKNTCDKFTCGEKGMVI